MQDTYATGRGKQNTEQQSQFPNIPSIPAENTYMALRHHNKMKFSENNRTASGIELHRKTVESRSGYEISHTVTNIEKRPHRG
jgi:hypothetical protein